MLGFLAAGAIIPASAEAWQGYVLIPGVLVGIAVIATGQLWALRPYLGKDSWLFFAATIIGAGLGALVCLALAYAWWTWFFEAVSVPLLLAVGGALLGGVTALVQWLVLRQRFARLTWWVPAYALAGMMGALALYYIGTLLNVREGGSLLLTLVVVAVGALVVGAITGWAVVESVKRET